MSVDAIADATENILRASQLQQPTLDSLKAQFKNPTQALGAPGCHDPTDIETLVGLEGQFLWSEDPFILRTITFTFDTDKVGFQEKTRSPAAYSRWRKASFSPYCAAKPAPLALSGSHGRVSTRSGTVHHGALPILLTPV